MTRERSERIARLVESGAIEQAAISLEQEARADIVHGRLFRALAQRLVPTGDAAPLVLPSPRKPSADPERG